MSPDRELNFARRKYYEISLNFIEMMVILSFTFTGKVVKLLSLGQVTSAPLSNGFCEKTWLENFLFFPFRILVVVLYGYGLSIQTFCLREMKTKETGHRKNNTVI